MSEDAPQIQPRATQILPMVTPWFAEAFELYAQEEVSWEVTFLQFPTNTQGEFLGLIGVYAAINGVLPKTLVMANQQIQPYHIDEEAVFNFVRLIMEGLRQSRSNQLQEMNEAATKSARNGQPPPTNGLIIPGR